MQNDIRLGVLLPTGQAQWGEGTDPRELIPFALRAEELGYDSLFANDSLLTPRIEALTMLSALAAVTRRAALGTGALLPFLRRPVQAGHALASLDLLSGGRLLVAVGAGFPGRFGRPLYELSELPWADRFRRLDETVALWRRLWTADEPFSFRGDLLHLDDVPPSIRPHTPGGPPVWLGGATPAALARTGRLYDGWLPYPPDPADYRTGLTAAHAAAGAAGRGPEAITPALFVSVLVDDDPAEARARMDAYARATYGLPLDELRQIQAVLTGPAPEVAAGLRRYLDAGARHLVLRLGGLTLKQQYDQLERIAVIRYLLH
ncbi:alkanesulfonate monooxygenase SsuD/methylene tetrahydromethanopterin reductase-like flavin-dependent oxidoreductase (luciferase family) [Streptomyces sp. TLI_235]|nr:LLM class flavin-dependent oxidoreductase [Streptomyces sp. TLI_235]PBC79541.1 alkanesulfonate monooxygenase SsuD/methylene tetrahydromethanopterin reductase-like flavin-dependent oxidoreductase (luciferase family) [Streptomyces sp. TLI_235]